MPSALRSLVALLLLVTSPFICAIAAQETSPSPTAPRKLRALLITGGCCHDYDNQKNLIARGLEARCAIEVTVVQQGGSATNSRIPLYEDPNWADGYDVVLHDECFADVDDPAWTARVLEPHRRGVPAVVIHCAMHCYRDGTDQWFEFCGVTSRTHGSHYPHEVLNRDGDHPIMREFGAAWANPAGELYWIEKLHPTAHPLASARNRERGTDEVCVWTNDYRGTRVFGTTLGHHNETVEADEFLDLLARGTLWACDRLDETHLVPETPTQRPVDLARGARASASSEETGRGNIAAHAVDGVPGTRWCASGPDAPQTLEIELSEPRSLRGCRIDWEFADQPYRHRFEISADGETWETIAEATDRDRATAAQQRTSETGITHAFEREGVTHARVVFLGGAPGAWGSIRELQLFGTETEIVDPQAARDAADAELLSEVKVAEGFRATLFARPPAVSYPVFVATEPDGTTYVSVDRNGSLDREPRRGSIQRLRDLDGDGRADESKLFVPDVDSPRGLVWMRDRLIVLHPPHLTAFIDADHDGIAESSQRLVSDIAFGFADRPADHSSNGVTLGIDGWLYLAIGDFGFLEATGSDGRKLQLRGGGVVRVRPDGSGLHVHSRGTRNILEVGLSPRLDGFARDNTNDGGGWDIRLHHFGGGEDHGYPTRYMNFTDEIVAPLADYGGGSGCGACWIDEPGLPDGYGSALYTADWGRDAIYRHRMTPQGGTFAADQTEFLRLPRATDLDVDGAGRIVAASWRGATFNYAGEEVGFLVRVEPIDHRPTPVLDTSSATEEALVEAFVGPSHRQRLAAQRELLARGWSSETAERLTTLAADRSMPLDGRIAALFTLALGLGDRAEAAIVSLSDDPTIRAWAIRALADLPVASERRPIRRLASALADADPRVRLEAIRAIGMIDGRVLARDLVRLLGDSDPLVRHTAAETLIAIDAWAECLEAWSREEAFALAALKTVSRMPHTEVVAALAEAVRVRTEEGRAVEPELFAALARLRYVEGVWNGASWGTRPDTRGPVYQPEEWVGSDAAAAALDRAIASAEPGALPTLMKELRRHRSGGSPFTERLTELRRRDDRYYDAWLDWLADESSLGNEAIEELAALLDDGSASDERVARGLAIAWRVGGFDGKLLLAPLARLRHDGSPAFRDVFDAMRRPESVARQSRELLRSIDDPELGTLAIALLVAIDAPAGDGPGGAEVTAAMQRAWEAPGGALRWLDAIELAGDRRWEDRILQGVGSSDMAIAARASSLAERWSIEPLEPGAGPSIAERGRDEVLAAIGARGSSEALGARWFARLNCANCHTIRADETPRGPHLPNVAKTYDRTKLAEALLFPSRSLAQGFVTESFETADGRSLTGFVVREEAERIAVRDAQGREHLIDLIDIEARVRQDISVMPEGLVDPLAPSDLEALLDYLQSLQ